MSSVVLLTGATGFVGRHVLPRLLQEGYEVRCASRHPERAARLAPEASWVRLDLAQPETLEPALAGVSAAVYLVHGMAEGPGYAARELAGARAFRDAAQARGLERLVYLGGVAPVGAASPHLRSRLRTGEVLRAGAVPTFELRAGMIVGHGSVSWKIVRDLSFRLPAMVLPRWLASLSRPVAIDDVAFAIEKALGLPLSAAGVYDLPGPETLSAKEILLRVAALHGTRPLMLSVPLLTPRLSSYWLKLVSGADYRVARELVAGLSSDLLPSEPEFWSLVPEHQLLSFDHAATRALDEEARVARHSRKRAGHGLASPSRPAE